MKNSINKSLAAAALSFGLSAQASSQENTAISAVCDTTIPTTLAQRSAANKIPSAVQLEIYPSTITDENPQIARDVSKKITQQALAVYGMIFGCQKGNEEMNALGQKLKDKPASEADIKKLQNFIKYEQLQDLKKIYTQDYFIHQSMKMMRLFYEMNEPEWNRNSQVFQLVYATTALTDAVRSSYDRLVLGTVWRDIETIFNFSPEEHYQFVTIQEVVQRIVSAELEEMAKRYEAPTWIREKIPS